MCEMGGSLDVSTGSKFGFQSRSLKAAYYLREAGYKKVGPLPELLPLYPRLVAPPAR